MRLQLQDDEEEPSPSTSNVTPSTPEPTSAASTQGPVVKPKKLNKEEIPKESSLPTCVESVENNALIPLLPRTTQFSMMTVTFGPTGSVFLENGHAPTAHQNQTPVVILAVSICLCQHCIYYYSSAHRARDMYVLVTLGIVIYEFCDKYKIYHKTSSPGHSKSNCRADAALKAAKIMKLKYKEDGCDECLTLLQL